jgi:N-acetylglucosaminyldiphosphoundecaprenol N-acetyl-beta-D-mannosaminyltransferase
MDFVAEENFDNIITDLIMRPAQQDELPAVITPNVDLTVHLNNNTELLSRFQHARFILPDGSPIILFSKLLKRPLKNRLAGSDLFPKMWKALIKHNKKAFLVIPNEEVKTKLEHEYSNAQFYIPPFFEATESDIETESRKIFPMLVQFQPDYVFLGLRYPKQEMLIVNLYDKLKEANAKIPLFFNLGASYEFYTGMKQRAPLWMQNSGLEWLHRFLSEPKRTFKRYFWDDLAIFKLFVKELFSK